MNGVNETNKTNTSNELFTADKIEAVKQEGRSLVRECIKERSRFSRVFETKNGEKAAVIYPKAVHFKKDDAWEAIDNTLVLSKDQLAYENAQGRMKVRIARMPKQTDHKKKMMLLNLEEHQNANSALQDQTEEKSGIIELASVEKDGFMISWGLKTQEEKMQEEKPAMLSQMNESEVAEVPVEFKPNPVSIQTAEEKLLKLSKLSSAGYFREILPGMDIRYRLESEVMKEEIILKKKEAAAETITFVMKHPGLSMHVLVDGSVALCKMQGECENAVTENDEHLANHAESSDKNAVFFLDAPILFDKNGEVVKAAYQIEKGQGISEITIRMDLSWLLDENRAYPITVDPTVRIEKKQTTIDDAFVRSKDPNILILATYPAETMKQILSGTFGAVLFSALILLPAVFIGNPQILLIITTKVFVSVTLIGILSAGTSWNKLTASLRSFHIPDIFIFTLDITLKYIAVLGEICMEILTSLRLRSVGQNRKKAQSFSGILGISFLKSREMAEEMYAAMCCRGFVGEYKTQKTSTFRKQDILSLLLMIGVTGIFIYFEGLWK